jgi:hypothetical protein
MSDFNKDDVDWGKVRRNLVQANDALGNAESEIANGFEDADELQHNNDLTQLALGSDDIPHDIDELIKGVTSSSSYLRNGTMNYIP